MNIQNEKETEKEKVYEGLRDNKCLQRKFKAHNECGERYVTYCYVFAFLKPFK